MNRNHSTGTAVLPARAFGVQGKEAAPRHLMPLTVESAKLFRSAEAMLFSARDSDIAAESFEFAHFAALRVAGALIAGKMPGVRTRKPETIWQKLSRLFPELSIFAVVFEESAALRVRLESGDHAFLSEGSAELWIQQAQQFLDSARELFSESQVLSVSVSGVSK